MAQFNTQSNTRVSTWTRLSTHAPEIQLNIVAVHGFRSNY